MSGELVGFVFRHFSTRGVFECDLAYRRSVGVSRVLYKIRCNPMHPLYGALPVPYVPVRVTRGAVIAHRYTYAPPRGRTQQYLRTIIPLSVSLWNYLSDPLFDGVGLGGFKSRASAFLLAQLLTHFLSPADFPFFFFHSMGWYCGAGVFRPIGCLSLSPSLALPTFFNNNNVSSKSGSSSSLSSKQLLQLSGRTRVHFQQNAGLQQQQQQVTGQTFRPISSK